MTFRTWIPDRASQIHQCSVWVASPTSRQGGGLRILPSPCPRLHLGWITRGSLNPAIRLGVLWGIQLRLPRNRLTLTDALSTLEDNLNQVLSMEIPILI